MQLSEHLTLAEVTKSQTATRLGIDNSPTIAHLESLRSVANNIFEPIRNHFGVPIAVTSGYRSKALNDAIKGSRRSQHCHGQAIDIDADVYGRITNGEIFDYVKNHLDFDQLIWEFGNDPHDTNANPDWVHVSYVGDGTNRGEILIAYRENGRTRYKKWK
jgi:hypothetical protein